MLFFFYIYFQYIMYICIFLESYLNKQKSSFNKMKRKAIKHGPSSLTISLPSRWVKNNNIRKGDEINVDETGASLRVYPGKQHLLTKKTQVDFSNIDKQTIRIMLSVLYEAGYDEIIIKFKGSETIKTIQNIISPTLLGYEVVEQRDNVCVVRNVTGDHVSELSPLIRRAFLVALSLAENSLHEINKKRMEKLEELLVLEKTNNKLTNYCHRLLNKNPWKDKKIIYTYLIIWVFESICDDYRDLIKMILKNKKMNFSNTFIEKYKEINNLLRKYYDLFYKYSDEEFMKLRRAILDLRKAFPFISFNAYEKQAGLFLFSILNRIYDCLGSTIGMHH